LTHNPNQFGKNLSRDNLPRVFTGKSNKSLLDKMKKHETLLKFSNKNLKENSSKNLFNIKMIKVDRKKEDCIKGKSQYGLGNNKNEAFLNLNNAKSNCFHFQLNDESDFINIKNKKELFEGENFFLVSQKENLLSEIKNENEELIYIDRNQINNNNKNNQNSKERLDNLINNPIKKVDEKHIKNLCLKSSKIINNTKHVKIIYAASRSSKDFLRKDLQLFKQNNIIFSNNTRNPNTKNNLALNSKSHIAFICKEIKLNPAYIKKNQFLEKQDSIYFNDESASIDNALIDNNDINNINDTDSKNEQEFINKINHSVIFIDKDKENLGNDISFRSFSRVSSTNDVWNAEEEEKINKRIEDFQNEIATESQRK
jgi:hypothetical protein